LPASGVNHRAMTRIELVESGAVGSAKELHRVGPDQTPGTDRK
jgi:hypothetical protein